MDRPQDAYLRRIQARARDEEGRRNRAALLHQQPSPYPRRGPRAHSRPLADRERPTLCSRRDLQGRQLSRQKEKRREQLHCHSSLRRESAAGRQRQEIFAQTHTSVMRLRPQIPRGSHQPSVGINLLAIPLGAFVCFGSSARTGEGVVTARLHSREVIRWLRNCLIPTRSVHVFWSVLIA